MNLQPNWYLASILRQYSVLAMFLNYSDQYFTHTFHVSDFDDPSTVASFLRRYFMLVILLIQIYLFWLNW